MSPRAPLKAYDCGVLSSDDEENSSEFNESGSDQEGEFVCMVCKHKKMKDKVTTYEKNGTTFATCKECRNSRNRIKALVQTDKSYQRAWEAMGTQPGAKNSFVAKCHHAMGEHLSARFEKHINKMEHRSVTDGRVEGGRLLMSPEVEALYAGFPEERKKELIDCHKRNAFAEKSRITGVNKYYSDDVKQTHEGCRKRAIEITQDVRQDMNLKKPRAPRQKNKLKSVSQPRAARFRQI